MKTEPKTYHHPFSPSSLGRRRMCPGSFQIEQGASKPTQEFAAGVEGTKLHSVMAYLIEERKAQVAVADPCYIMDSLTVEQKNTVLECMAWLDDTIEDFCMDTSDNHIVDYMINVEQEMSYSNGDMVVCSGTADALIFTPGCTDTPYMKRHPDSAPDKMIIVDWKFGRAAIDPTNATMQLLGYAVLVFENYDDVDEVISLIYQPRTGGLYQAQFIRPNLSEYKAQIEDTIAACRVAEPVIEPSEAACVYCTGIAVCPKVQELSREMVESVGQGLTADPEEAVGALLAFKDSDELGEIYSQSKVVTQYAKAVKDFCKEALAVGGNGTVTGWKLQSRKGRKSIVNNIELPKLLDMKCSEILVHGTVRLQRLEKMLLSPMISSIELLRYADIGVSSLEKAYVEREHEVHGTPKTQARKTFYKLICAVMETADDVKAIVKEAKKND